MFSSVSLLELAYIKYFSVSLLEPWQKHLNKPEAYPEPYQASKM